MIGVLSALRSQRLPSSGAEGRIPTCFIVSPALRETVDEVVCDLARYPHCLDPLIDTWLSVEVCRDTGGGLALRGLVRRNGPRQFADISVTDIP